MTVQELIDLLGRFDPQSAVVVVGGRQPEPLALQTPTHVRESWFRPCKAAGPVTVVCTSPGPEVCQ